MGFGENAQASLITRGLAEMTRLGVALGADPLTFAGLAGIGDLIATCTSPLSRNRTFGVQPRAGHDRSTEAEAAMRQTCEGVKSCRPILDLARAHGVDMPITEAVVQAVHEGLPPTCDGAVADDPRPVAGRLTGRAPAGASRVSAAGCQVGPEVLDVLDPDREPDERLAAPSRSPTAHRRRRSRVDSTPPRLVAWIHSADPVGQRVGRGRGRRRARPSTIAARMPG